MWCEWKLEQLERYDKQRKISSSKSLKVYSAVKGLEEFPPVVDEAVLQGIVPGTSACDIVTKLQCLYDRQLFNTTNGRFGFVICGAQPGDLVCVFNSATTPHVLRKVSNGSACEVYRIIGDAYVSDLMYGESDVLDIPVQDITLV
jgi:hypothetical protein